MIPTQISMLLRVNVILLDDSDLFNGLIDYLYNWSIFCSLVLKLQVIAGP